MRKMIQSCISPAKGLFRDFCVETGLMKICSDIDALKFMRGDPDFGISLDIGLIKT